MRNYGQFYAICNKIGISKQDIVSGFTKGRTDSLTALSDTDFNALMVEMQKFNTVPPGDLMRKKMLAIAKQMQWGKTTNERLKAIDNWLMKQKFQKPLMQLDVPQLTLMVSVFEQRVLVDYLKGLNK